MLTTARYLHKLYFPECLKCERLRKKEERREEERSEEARSILLFSHRYRLGRTADGPDAFHLAADTAKMMDELGGGGREGKGGRNTSCSLLSTMIEIGGAHVYHYSHSQ